MKKFLASGCFVLAFQSFSQVTHLNAGFDETNGKRVLVKAIAVIVNSEAYRKVPPKRICLPSIEGPRI